MKLPSRTYREARAYKSALLEQALSAICDEEKATVEMIIAPLFYLKLKSPVWWVLESLKELEIGKSSITFVNKIHFTYPLPPPKRAASSRPLLDPSHYRKPVITPPR